MSNICLTDDDYVRWIPRWVATLSDGTTVYQDDDRPGVSPPGAWDRLKNYCSDNFLNVSQLRLQFRSNSVHIPLDDAEGVYFAKSLFGFWGVNQTFNGFWVGAIRGGKAHITHYKTPELVPLESQTVENPENRYVILTENKKQL